MARLQQTSVEQFFLGWYGTSEDACEPFILRTGSTIPTYRHAHFPEEGDFTGTSIPKSTFFKLVREVPTSGSGFLSYSGNDDKFTSLRNAGVTELQCGRAYCIILKPGSDFHDIPEFQFANQATTEYKKLISNS